MGIISAMRAALEALDDPRPDPGRPAAAASQAAPQAPSPLGPVVESLAVRVADLEAQLKSMRSYVDQETDRARRASEGARSAVRRLTDSLEGSGEFTDASEGVPGVDAPAGHGPQLHPVHGGVEAAAPPSPEAIRAAARRAVALS